MRVLIREKPMPRSSLSVSAIVPTWNRREELEVCLMSLSELEVEVVVVDNGSTDGTVRMLTESFPNVRQICNSENLGAARAKNQGAMAARGEVLWFLDSDSEVPDAEVVSRALELLASQRDIGAVGGEIFRQTDGRKEWRLKNLLLNGETRTDSLEDGYQTTVEVDYLPSCNLFIRRALFFDLGGFDPGYFFLVEDVDLCLRVWRAGYRCVADDGASVFHTISLRGREGDLFLVHRNRVRLALLHFSPQRIAALPLLDLLYMLRPYKVLGLWQGKISVDKHVPESLRGQRRGRRHFIGRAAGVGMINLASLARGYAWNLVRLPETLRLRRESVDFLKDDCTKADMKPGRKHP